MGSTDSQAKTSARARIEEMRRKDQTRNRRLRALIVTVSAVVVVGLAGGGWYLASGSDSKANDNADGKQQAASGPVKGEKTWSNLSQNHVTKDVDYPVRPPVGGDHNPVWQNCNGDVYDKPLTDENAVHSLEHGAVWVTYNDKAPGADIKALQERVAKTPYSLMSPYADQSAPITLTAWGHQLGVAKASDTRVAQFFARYVQGDQTPEPGAACTGGKSS